MGGRSRSSGEALRGGSSEDPRGAECTGVTAEGTLCGAGEEMWECAQWQTWVWCPSCTGDGVFSFPDPSHQADEWSPCSSQTSGTSRSSIPAENTSRKRSAKSRRSGEGDGKPIRLR
jgi:hypothetical protein